MTFTFLFLLQGWIHADQTSHQMGVVTTFGDQVTRFEMTGGDNGGVIRIITAKGDDSKRDLNKRDFAYILKRFKDLPRPPSVPESCARTRVDIRYSKRGAAEIKSSCFGVSSITSPEYVRFVNLLARATGFY